MSDLRKRYFARLIGRFIVLLLTVYAAIYFPDSFDILNGYNFFSALSPLHLLWGVWVLDMILQIVPIKNKLPLGSQKLFFSRFRAAAGQINHKALKDYIKTTTKAAYKVFILWCLLLLAIGKLYYSAVIGKIAVFVISVFFYVCDLICVLIWCPFRLIMNTRCCTTCRIFNWDHLMMFSPLIFIGGFYSLSLAALAAAAWLIWELCVLTYPERFWEGSNLSLKCSQCTDKLCTQYCQKLRV